MQIVYPGNPGEYEATVREIIVLLATAEDKIVGMAVEQLEDIVAEGLARSFGEAPPLELVRQTAELIMSQSGG